MSVSASLTCPPQHLAVPVERLQFDRAAVASILQLDPARDSHVRWYRAITELQPAIARLCRPQMLLRIDAAAHRPREIRLSPGVTLTGAIVEFLAHAQAVATFVVTIGSGPERLCRGWMRTGGVRQSLIADALASEYTEALAAACQAEIQHRAQAVGLQVTPRYSHGYCGIVLSQQRTILSGLPLDMIGVRLEPSAFLRPGKSISGLLGIGPPDRVHPDRYPCSTCTHAECAHRRAPFEPATRSLSGPR